MKEAQHILERLWCNNHQRNASAVFLVILLNAFLLELSH